MIMAQARQTRPGGARRDRKAVAQADRPDLVEDYEDDDHEPVSLAEELASGKADGDTTFDKVYNTLSEMAY